MTTAHRPTWVPKQGGEQRAIYGASSSTKARNIASHTKLKYRKDGQGSTDDIEQRDLLSELSTRESQHLREKQRALTEQGLDIAASADPDNRLTFVEQEREKAMRGKTKGKGLDDDDEDGEDGPRLFQASKLDADDDNNEDDDRDDSDEDDDDEDDDDEDDTHALLAELERIKKEREEEEASRQADEAAAAAREKEEELVVGNPLLQADALMGAGGGKFGTKRRWDDDVVFRNQAKTESKTQRRFINDTVRNDFHKRFLDRYIK